MTDLRVGAGQVAAYLVRLGAERPAAADAAALRELHERHLRNVPFENLSIHLGEEIVLTPKDLVDKVTVTRRGGFCYELNGAFAGLLASLGYRVELLAARVHVGDGFSPPFDHLALRVEAADDSGPWLVDVGFGRHSTYPLLLDERSEQRDPGGVFRVTDGPDGDLDVWRDGEPQYRLERRPRGLADFEMACWWQCTSPASHFTQSLVCTLLTETGRITLSGRTLVTTDAAGRHEEELGEAEALATYRDRFGILLDRLPVPRNG